MTQPDEKLEDSTPAMWPAQNLAERLVNVVFESASDAAAAVAKWCQQQALEQQLRALDDRELADLGVTREQLSVLASSQDAPELMRRMMERLGVSQELLSKYPGLKHQLERECSLCFSRGECRHWLGHGNADDGHKAFCPNASTFEDLKAKG